MMRYRLLAPALLLLVSLASAAKTDNLVDTGSYGVFVNGKRVATETFKIVQRPGFNVVHSEVKVEDGELKATQKSELLVTPLGLLRRYQWNELSPGKAQTVVEPDGEFLIERTTLTPKEKPQEQPYLMPATTMVLDDYFFTHRQLLAWRYMAGSCKAEGPQIKCQRAQFGAIVPRQHGSFTVTVEPAGNEKVVIRGAERDLFRFNLQGDGLDWALWLDKDFKLIRVLVKSEQTEVVRD